MYVERLKIENFRNIRETEFELNYPGKEGGAGLLPNVNLFLGDNGSGKTSVFRALILCIMGRDIAYSGFRSDFLIRRHIDQESTVVETAIVSTVLRREPVRYSQLQLDFGEDEGSSLGEAISLGISIQSGDTTDEIWDDDFRMDEIYSLENRLFLPAIERSLVIAYGANRRTERPEGYRENSRSRRYQQVASIFEDFVGMVPFDYGMLLLDRNAHLGESIEILNNLLPSPIQVFPDTNPYSLYGPYHETQFTHNGVRIPFSSLSDGFRTFIGWVWDLMLQLSKQAKVGERLVDQTGIVIVDEIDLLLHPEWQRVVIPKVAKAFPNIQFCFSTHSPLVAGTVERENLFVMETEPDGSAVVRQYREEVHGLTPNQILTSPYFGLESVRAADAEPLETMLAREANGNGSAESHPLTPNPAFNEWLDDLLEKEGAAEATPKRARRKKPAQD